MLNSKEVDGYILEYSRIYLDKENNKEDYILIETVEIRSGSFWDVTLYNKGEKIFLGRYVKEIDLFIAAYNKDNILIYAEAFNRELKKMVPIKVFYIYNYKEDMTYNLTEEEAVKLFDPNMYTKDLMTPNKKIYREDLEKRKRLEGPTEFLSQTEVKEMIKVIK